MLRSGAGHLQSMRDGRVVSLGANGRVADVTTHPAVPNTARSIAILDDLKRDRAQLEAMLAGMTHG